MKWNIELLSEGVDCSAFECGQPWLDRYLKSNALRNQQKGYGRTYIAPKPETQLVAGYYTVSMSSVQFASLPESLTFSAMPKYPMPTAHLACLAVSSDCQRQGLGSFLLIDAMRRMVGASEIIAARAIDVKAIDEAARDWYIAYGFTPFKDINGPPFHLFLPIETARQIVMAAAAQ